MGRDFAGVNAAIRLLPQLDAFVTYDECLANTARTLGLPVVRPA